MTDILPEPNDAAVAWHLAIATMDVDRWDDFVAWLEADPAHAAAYDAVAHADHRLGHIPPPLAVVPQGDTLPPARNAYTRRWIGGAIAACLVGLVAVGTLNRPDQHQADQPYDVVTAAGTTRTLALADGSTVVANGGTHLRLDHGDPRNIKLEQGEALFTVRHDPAKPFVVTIGQIRVVDIGTVFNILRDGSRLSVSVSEGSVQFESKGAKVALRAGQSLMVDEAQGHLVRGAAIGVGGWQKGELQFAGESLADVAAAVHRRTGAKITLSNYLSALTFTGNIKLTGEAAQDAAHLAALVGADLQRDGENWALSSEHTGSSGRTGR